MRQKKIKKIKIDVGARVIGEQISKMGQWKRSGEGWREFESWKKRICVDGPRVHIYIHIFFDFTFHPIGGGFLLGDSLFVFII